MNELLMPFIVLSAKLPGSMLRDVSKIVYIDQSIAIWSGSGPEPLGILVTLA